MLTTRAEQTLIPGVVAALLAACSNEQAQPPQPETTQATTSTEACADIYLINGRFFSMDELPEQSGNTAQSNFDSMRISGNTIAEVGNGIVPAECAQTIDLHGRTVLPGLIDTHMHFIRATLRPGHDARELELSRSIAEAMEMVAARRAQMAAQGVANDQWITFIGGWDPIQWDENPIGSGRGGGPEYIYPSLQQMDAAADEYPFYIHLRSTETAYTNSTGIARLTELAAEHPDEGDPQIDPDTGFVGNSTVAFRLIKFDSDPGEQAVRVMRGFNRVGLTSVVDVGGSIRGRGAQYFNVRTDYATIKSLYDDDALTIRVRSRVQGDTITPLADYEALARSIEARFGSDDDSMFKVIGLGEDLGNVQENGYQETVEMALANGWQIGVHAGSLEDIDVYHDAATATGTTTRLTLEHSPAGAAEFSRIAELGYENVVGINLGPHSFLGRGAAGQRCNANPYRTASELGLHVGLGTDSTNAQPSNPWVNIYSIVTGKDVKGFGLRAGGELVNESGERVTCPDERVSRARAVQMYTKGSAWLAEAEDHYGVLEAGKLADLIVLSDDIFSTDVSDEEIWKIHSLLTIVDGDIVYVDDNAPFAAEATL